MGSLRTVADLRWSVDFSHHAWTRPAATGSPEAMLQASEHTLAMIDAADRAGLESAWISEDPDGWDAYAILAAAARSTRSIKLGTGVTNPYLRDPNLLAMSTSTVDRMTGGRTFLGLGRGQPEWYPGALGSGTRSSPLTRLETTIRLLRQWWQPPYRARSGTEPVVNDWARSIWPAQERIPIYLAAIGPRALDLAARLADGVLIADFASLPFLERLVPEIRDKVSSYGRDPDSFRFFVRTGITVTDDPAVALRYRKTLMAILSPLPGMSRQIEHPDYDVPAIIDRVAQAMGTREVLRQGGNFIDIRLNADFGAAREAIPDGLINDLSYIGSAGEVQGKLQRLAEIGVTDVFLSPPDEADSRLYTEQIRAISESELPEKR